MNDQTAVQNSIGQDLRHYREYNQMTVEQVAQELYISREHIEAMENDEYLNNKELSVFMRGYYRNYAKVVGYPVEQLEERLIAEGAMKPRTSTPSHKFEYSYKNRFYWRRWISLFIITLIIIFTVVWCSQKDSNQTSQQGTEDNSSIDFSNHVSSASKAED